MLTWEQRRHDTEFILPLVAGVLLSHTPRLQRVILAPRKRIDSRSRFGLLKGSNLNLENGNVMKIPSQLRIALKKLIFEIRIRFYPILHRFRTWTRKAYQAYRQSEPDWLSIDFHTSASFNSRCLCISLVEDPRFDNRRVFFQKYAERFGWPFAFWPATNGGCLKEIPLWINQGRRPSHPAPLSRGEIGLLITTKALYEWSLEQELDFLVVFEDDAAIHMAPRLELPQKFDFVFFNNRFSGDLQGRLKSGWGADGYVVSKEGIRKMLAIMQADVGEPLDDQPGAGHLGQPVVVASL